MKIPRYWAKETQRVKDPRGKALDLACWRWSDWSEAEARMRAREAMAQMARKLHSNQPLDRYGYGEQPLREEVVEDIPGPGRDPIGVITRNRYGALVLNAAQVMFVDLDLAQGSGLVSGLVKGLLGKKSASAEPRALERLETWVNNHPEWGFRVYRTRAGLRCLVMHDVFDPSQPSTTELLLALESDPLYVKLCRDQGCFRARLTPKPWRCHMLPPPSRYPWESSKDEQRFREWQRLYEVAIGRYGVCELVREFRSRDHHPEAALVLAVHDRRALSQGNLPLA